MAEITYLMGSDVGGSSFYTDAAAYFSARPEVTLGLIGGGQPHHLDDVLTDLRARATSGDTFAVIDIVTEPAAAATLSFPISSGHLGAITRATLEAALSNAGGAGYPAVLGAPAISDATSVCIYGPDVGTDTAFVTMFGQIFGPELTVYAPLHPQDFQGDLPLAVDDGSQFRKTTIASQLAPSDHPLPPPEPEEPVMTQQFGKYRATVTDDNDPESKGRLEIDIPALGVSGVWADASLPPIPASLVQLPPISSVVWVEFEAGDVRFPVWTGVAWGTDLGEDVTLASQGMLTLRANKGIEVTADMGLVATAGMNVGVTAGTFVDVSAGTTVDLSAGAKLALKAPVDVDVSAGLLSVTAATSNFSGIVQAETLVAQDGVVSPSYTPGAGNLQ